MSKREIKFRAWDGEKMHPVCYLETGDNDRLYCVGPNQRELDGVPVMQFTGLHDYTVLSLEIYEGDILYCNEHDEYMDVFYDDGAFRVLWSFDDEAEPLTQKMIKANWLKRVGNIYQDPELLEQ